MSRTDQSILIGADHPEFYADLLPKIPRPANWRLSDGRPCPDVPGIQNLDDALSLRLQTLLNAVADISLRGRGNVSATMASLKPNKGTLETKLYIVFNHEDDDSALHCSEHLENIFSMLFRVPYHPAATGGSPKVIPSELEDDYIKICQAIHNYSFNVFQYRVTKRMHKLSEIKGYIERDRTDYFSDEQCKALLIFLDDVDKIIIMATTTTNQFPTSYIKIFLWVYSDWTDRNLLPRDPPPDNTLTLLDRADSWLAEKHHISFQLRRWALKIMSFVIATNRLFILTQSQRLNAIIHGNFSVQVLSSATTTPYRCLLSSETIQAALNAAVAEADCTPDDWDNKCEWFIAEVLGKLKRPIEVNHSKPTVHAELAMIIAMGEIEDDVLPYIGVSKLSCTMCSHYIEAFNEACGQRIVTKGTHGKAHPGWFWLSVPEHDEELRRAFLQRIRRQLLSDVEVYMGRRLSDSSVGSDGPGWKIGTRAGLSRLYEAAGL